MKINHIFTIGLAIFAVSAFTSCSDVKDLNAGSEYMDKFDNHGAPSIEGVYAIDDANCETPITSGVLNQYIKIKGQNLAQVKDLNINGLQVDIRERVYATTTCCYVRIPRAIPENETGIMTYETPQGKTQIAFPVSIPTIELDGLVNEFSLPGYRAQLSGDYFDLYNFGDTTETATVHITAVNEAEGYNKALKVDSCTETYTSIKIPADCPDNTLIKIEWVGMGNTKMTKTIPYRMSDQLLFGNFDGDLGSWDHNRDYVTDGTKDGDPESLGYCFWRYTNTQAAWDYFGTGWWMQWHEEWADITANPSKYYLKFEVCTAASCPFYDYGDNGANGAKNGGYSFSLNSGANAQWDPVTSGITNTGGKWRTIRIPLETLVDPEKGLPEVGGGGNFAFICQPNNNDGWDKVDHSFGQFRFEPKEY